MEQTTERNLTDAEFFASLTGAKPPTTPPPTPEEIERQAMEARLKKLATDTENEAWRLKSLRAGKLKPFEEFGMVPITPEFVAHIWRRTKLAPAPKKDLDALRELVAETDRLRAAQANYGSDRDGEVMKAERARHAAEVAAGKSNPVPPPDYPQIWDRLKEARASLEGQIREQNRKAVPYLHVIREKLLKAADLLADEISGAELELHQKTDALFNWEPVPSQTTVCLRQLSWRLPEVPKLDSFHLRIELAKLGVLL